MLPAPIWVSILSVTVALASLLYNALLAPGRSDRQELNKRLAKLELDDVNHENRLTGFSLQMERQGDAIEQRCAKIETQLSEVGRVREDVATVKAKLEAYGESIKDIKYTMNEILKLIRH